MNQRNAKVAPCMEIGTFTPPDGGRPAVSIGLSSAPGGDLVVYKIGSRAEMEQWIAALRKAADSLWVGKEVN
jgi:hypothetical protein